VFFPFFFGVGGGAGRGGGVFGGGGELVLWLRPASPKLKEAGAAAGDLSYGYTDRCIQILGPISSGCYLLHMAYM